MLLNICFALGQSRKTAYLCHMRHTTLFIFLLLAATLHAQQTFRGRVVDAETGEPLPYAIISVSKGQRTLTNEEGHFTIEVKKNDTIRIRYVGYVEECRNSNAQDTVIRLQPFKSTLKEVTIHPINIKDVLDKVSARLEKEYRKYGKKTSTYFWRSSQQIDDYCEMLEAFIRARSALNLRNMNMLGGRRGKLVGTNMETPQLANTNMHHALEIGPIIKDVFFWSDIRGPLEKRLGSKRAYEQYYDLNFEIKRGSAQDEDIYAIEMKHKRNTKGKKFIDGTLYVNATDFRILRFEAIMPTLQVIILNGLNSCAPLVRAKVNINYRHTKGFTEVDNLNCIIEGGIFISRTLLFNVDDMEVPLMPAAETITDNASGTEYMARFDSALWARSGIIQRTALEERLAFGAADSLNQIKKEY